MFKLDESSKGFIAVFISFLAWGTLAIYWSSLTSVSPFAIAAYRIICSFILVSLLLTLAGKWKNVRKLAQERNNIIFLSICGILIGTNWTLYVVSIHTGHLMQSSIGNYITPLTNTLVGALFFKEKLRVMQKYAIGVVAIGIVYMLLNYGSIPIFALLFTTTFTAYSAIHKLVKAKVLDGMFFEMLILIVPASTYLIVSSTPPIWAEGSKTIFLILLSGPVTALPLIGFAYGIQRMPLSSVGIVQYLNPTATFILAILYFKEPFPIQHFIVFCFIWVGVIIYVIDAINHRKNKKYHKRYPAH